MKLTPEFLNNMGACQYGIDFADFHNLGDYDFNELGIIGDYNGFPEWIADEFKSCTFDDNGNKLTHTDSKGRVLSYTYDDNGNMLSRTHWDGGISRWTYDDNGNKLTHIWPDGSVESWTYNDRNDVLTHDLSGDIRQNIYDTKGNMTSIQFACSNTVDMTYDDSGNMLTRTYFDSRTEYWTYDDNGNMLAFVDVNGDKTAYTYDDNGNKLTETDFRSHTAKWTYDENNKLISHTDLNGNHYSNQNLPDGILAQVFNKDDNIILEIKLKALVIIEQFGIMSIKG